MQYPSIHVTPYHLAHRFVGLREDNGVPGDPQIMAMLHLDAEWPSGDHVPWCSAFVNYIAWLLGLPRSKSLRARSWLRVGRPVSLEDAVYGFDVVVLKRGKAPQPGPRAIKAPGHVGFFVYKTDRHVCVLGGNQGDKVCQKHYPLKDVLAVRRLLL